MEQNITFNRCMDFLSRMIEKYGQELLDEISSDKNNGNESQIEYTEGQKKSQ